MGDHSVREFFMADVAMAEVEVDVIDLEKFRRHENRRDRCQLIF